MISAAREPSVHAPLWVRTRSWRTSVSDEALPNSPAQVAQAAAAFRWDEGKAEAGIGIALSGGGFRAMLFHAGALARMNELGLLSKAKRISSVSGGSIISGHLALSWSMLGAVDGNGTYANFKVVVVDPILAFSRKKIDVVDALTGLLPWTSASEQVAKSYDEYLSTAGRCRTHPIPRVSCSVRPICRRRAVALRTNFVSDGGAPLSEPHPCRSTGSASSAHP